MALARHEIAASQLEAPPSLLTVVVQTEASLEPVEAARTVLPQPTEQQQLQLGRTAVAPRLPPDRRQDRAPAAGNDRAEWRRRVALVPQMVRQRRAERAASSIRQESSDADDEPDKFIPFLINQMVAGPAREEVSDEAQSDVQQPDTGTRIRYSAPAWVGELPVPLALGDMYDIQSLREQFEATKSGDPNQLPVIAKLAFVYTVARTLDTLTQADTGIDSHKQIALDEAYTFACGRLGGRIDYDLAAAFQANPEIADGVNIQYRDTADVVHIDSCREKLVITGDRLAIRGEDGMPGTLSEDTRRRLVLGAVGVVRSTKAVSRESEDNLPTLNVVASSEGTALMRDIRDLARGRAIEVFKAQCRQKGGEHDVDRLIQQLGWAVPSPIAAPEPMAACEATSVTTEMEHSDSDAVIAPDAEAMTSTANNKRQGRWISRLALWRKRGQTNIAKDPEQEHNEQSDSSYIQDRPAESPSEPPATDTPEQATLVLRLPGLPAPDVWGPFGADTPHVAQPADSPWQVPTEEAREIIRQSPVSNAPLRTVGAARKLRESETVTSNLGHIEPDPVLDLDRLATADESPADSLPETPPFGQNWDASNLFDGILDLGRSSGKQNSSVDNLTAARY